MGLPMIVAHRHSTKGPRVAIYCRALHRGLPAIPRIEIELTPSARSRRPSLTIRVSGLAAAAGRHGGLRYGEGRIDDRTADSVTRSMCCRATRDGSSSGQGESDDVDGRR
jgi:hypothetical protein